MSCRFLKDLGATFTSDVKVRNYIALNYSNVGGWNRREGSSNHFMMQPGLEYKHSLFVKF